MPNGHGKSNGDLPDSHVKVSVGSRPCDPPRSAGCHGLTPIRKPCTVCEVARSPNGVIHDPLNETSSGRASKSSLQNLLLLASSHYSEGDSSCCERRNDVSISLCRISPDDSSIAFPPTRCQDVERKEPAFRRCPSKSNTSGRAHQDFTPKPTTSFQNSWKTRRITKQVGLLRRSTPEETYDTWSSVVEKSFGLRAKLLTWARSGLDEPRPGPLLIEAKQVCVYSKLYGAVKSL